MILSISNLHVSVGDKPILKGLTLDVPAGEVRAIVEANGAGPFYAEIQGDQR